MLEEDDQPAAPELPDWLRWIWRAWSRLHHERPHVVGGFAAPLGGMTIRSVPGRIPWTAVRAWCRHHGHGADDMEMLEGCIAALDDVYLEWWGRQSKAG